MCLLPHEMASPGSAMAQNDPATQIGGAINLEAKQELKDLRISLTPHGVISGRIVDEDGEPRSEFNVDAIQSRWLGNKREDNSSAVRPHE